MKFTIITLALLGIAAADVSHLNNMYLPPHIAGLSSHKHVEYTQQSQEIPQVAEVIGNSVAEEVAAPEEEEAKTTGKLIVETVKYGPGYAGEIQSQTHESSAPAAHGSTVHTSTQQQGSSYTSTSHSHEEVEQQEESEKQDEPENKYYTGLIIPQHLQGSAAATIVEEHKEESAAPAAPGSDVYQSTQQQAAYWTQVSQQQEQEQQQQQEPEQKYYTGLVIPQSQVINSEQQHSSAVAPGSDAFTQQQASYYTQQSSEAAPSLGVSTSSGIETQYAANGGYVY